MLARSVVVRRIRVGQEHLDRAAADELDPLSLAMDEAWPAESPWRVTVRTATNAAGQQWDLTAPGRRLLSRWFGDDPLVRPVRVGLMVRRSSRDE